MAPPKGWSRFKADLKSATEKDYINIGNISKGDVEDEFTFVFSHPSLPHPSQIEIHAQPQDVQSYPSDNTFLVYTNDDIPTTVAQVLDDTMYEAMGVKVDNMLTSLSQRLRAVLENNGLDGAGDITMIDADSDVDASDLDMEDTDSSSDVPFEYDDDGYGSGSHLQLSEEGRPNLSPVPLPAPVMARFRRDLRSVLGADIHTGKVCGFGDSTPEGIVFISIRVNKLCLPTATREAWGLVPSDYIVLLIRYHGCYSTFEDIIDKPVENIKMEFRLRKCSKKKPSFQQAREAFTSQGNAPRQEMPKTPELSNLWISKSMDDFMNGEFFSILKIRNLYDVSWEKAKELHSQTIRSNKGIDTQNIDREEEPSNEAQLPSLLASDHFLSAEERSLPLIAMQFALRYLVRCTDYCTVCHLKVKGNFAALMPYVCSEPLCLHQYMNLGFGPSMDHEIIYHPCVVDLLISFCYASLYISIARNQVGLREFPTGLGLRVPKIRPATFQERVTFEPSDGANEEPSPPLANGHRYVTVGSEGYLIDPIDISFSWRDSVATMTGEYNEDILNVGQWVMVSTAVEVSPGYSDIVLHHARIESICDEVLQLNIVSRHTVPDRHNNIRLYDEIRVGGWPGLVLGHLVLYNDELDDLESTQEKAFSMKIVISGMPPVADMRSYLMSNRQPLSRWDRMPSASVDLLRWIIASNRSHIVQVDDGTENNKCPHSEKITGVDGWTQFRFTQGSPEKENLFNKALEEVIGSPKTLVAWHGSRLENWHSIVRQGLNYDLTENGRAYGNGIYFSRDFETSQGYSHSTPYVRDEREVIWPRSSLKAQAVVSLNELVNLPDKFKSKDPHLVVQHCHWTQCRYLFAHTAVPGSPPQTFTNLASIENHTTQPNLTNPSPSMNVPEFEQDPNWVTRGPKGCELFIPQYAIPSAQRAHDAAKRSCEREIDESGLESSEEDEEDIKFIWHEDEVTQASLTCETDFRPGTLDLSSLPQLAPPSYATNAAQRALGQEIKKLEKVQSSIPLHLLGWYIDFAKLNNLFQWIVEFHSFDPNLPLARDMKDVGLTSIVLEIRFLRAFPMSPPFVRVIRPRFLPFMDGGGGHVTIGGALCMELLTNSGWSPANSLESVLLQVRMAICSEEPRPARLMSTRDYQRDYDVAEAVEAYRRAAATHGWEVPADIAEVS
ncbi:hypothetical protein F4781DRAFT_177303 [Annulohypoxylon bovei var. microspora]|nr:hypothetical protein F4781DRAFT_177303 [Annulohypoxylon bovei var. microspora]